MGLIHGKIKVIGVSRSSEYSPNHVDNDAAILEVVAEKLRDKGCEVEIWPEKEFVSKQIRADFIFNMARDRSTIEYLKQLEDSGSLVVNSAYGVSKCMRKSMTELLIRNGFAHPISFIVPTDGEFTPGLFPCWIKRGDSHAMVKEDVVYVECKEEAERVMADFHSRGISEAVVNEHLSGDLVKFYGVQGTDFFFSFYSTDACHSKLGLEIVNGETCGYPFNKELLYQYSSKLAEIMNVPIYGGDCIISSTGEIRIIDFNDWPSFARCREEAGVKIAECIYHKVTAKLKE